MDMQQSGNFPCHLTMFWPDEASAEWFEIQASEILCSKFRTGCLQVPGFTRTGFLSWCPFDIEGGLGAG